MLVSMVRSLPPLLVPLFGRCRLVAYRPKPGFRKGLSIRYHCSSFFSFKPVPRDGRLDFAFFACRLVTSLIFLFSPGVPRQDRVLISPFPSNSLSVFFSQLPVSILFPYFCVGFPSHIRLVTNDRLRCLLFCSSCFLMLWMPRVVCRFQ